MRWTGIGPMDGRMIAIGLFFALAPALAMLWQARRMTREDLLADWAASHYLTVPEEHHETIAAHLRRILWTRGMGAAGGWIFGVFVPVPAGPWGGIFLGYIASTIVGEVTAQRHLGSGVASLAPRRLEAYVPTAALVAVRGIVCATLVLAVTSFVVERHPAASGRDLLGGLAMAAGVAVVGLGGEWASRRVVARRQTAGTSDLLAVDDALRSTSAHLLVASVLAAELLGLSYVAGVMASSVTPEVLRWLGVILVPTSLLAAVVTLHRLANRPWRVRRDVVDASA